MAAGFERAVAHFIGTCSYITATHDLITKWRLELTGGYFLDLYFNEALGKYSYTLVQANMRILGWDNAPHHPGHANFPHYVHLPSGQTDASSLTGDPESDLEQVRLAIEAFLSA